MPVATLFSLVLNGILFVRPKPFPFATRCSLVVRRAWTLGLGGVIALIAAAPFPATAWAASDTPIPFHIDYSAPASCPSQDNVVRGIRGWSERLRPMDGDTSAALVQIQAEHRGSNIVGRLRVRAKDGTESKREVSAEQCEEVVAALSLAAALSLDPLILPDTTASPASTTQTPEPTRSPALPSSDQDRNRVGRTSATNERTNSKQWGAGLVAGGMTALAPGLIWGGGVFLAHEDPLPQRLSLGIRATLSSWLSNAVHVDPGRAEFRAYLARAEGCLRLPALAAKKIVISSCGAIEAGALWGKGGDIGVADTRTRPWVAPVILGRLHWSLGRGVWVDASGDVLFPLVRDTFLFDQPRTEIHKVPAAGTGFRFGGGWAFW